MCSEPSLIGFGGSVIEECAKMGSVVFVCAPKEYEGMSWLEDLRYAQETKISENRFFLPSTIALTFWTMVAVYCFLPWMHVLSDVLPC